METIQKIIAPHEYWYCKQQVQELVKTYHAVADQGTIAAVQGLIQERTAFVFERTLRIQAYWQAFLHQEITMQQVESSFEELKQFVQPMREPSLKQIEKCFRKVKKMEQVSLAQIDFRELSYLGWNDSGTNRKYLVRESEGRFQGLYGSFGTNGQKGHCAICNQISTVGFFLATTKQAGDGTYTKRGNYICLDSQKCNQQITDVTFLQRFWETIS